MSKKLVEKPFYKQTTPVETEPALEWLANTFKAVITRSAIIHFDRDASFFLAGDSVILEMEYHEASQCVIPNTPGIGADLGLDILDEIGKFHI